MLEFVIYDDKRGNLERTAFLVREILEEEKIEYDLQFYSSSSEMLEKCKQPDIVILDIATNETSNIELGKELRQLFPEVRFIYTYTKSHERYCIQAVNEIHACLFLCKPIDVKELRKQLLYLAENSFLPQKIKTIKFDNITDNNGVKVSYMVLKLNDIIYIESVKVDRSVSIVHVNGRFTCFRVMDELAEELKKENFAINSRGQLVNLKHIVTLKGYDLYLDNGENLRISKRRITAFKKQINDFLHKEI